MLHDYFYFHVHNIDTGESVTAYLDSSLPPQQTVRHKSCELLVQCDTNVSRCYACSQYRSNLRAQVCRVNKRDIAQVSDPSSHINFRFMKTPEKDARLHELHRRESAMKKRLSRLKEKLDEATTQLGVSLEDNMTTDLVDIMQSQNDEVISSHSENSFPRLFWQEQYKAVLKSRKGMRWHPLMIR